jgi:hypothetical protein
MHPQEAARLLRGELEDALARPGDRPARAVALTILPPADLAPDTSFRVRACLDPHTVEVDLPTGLAMGYLADEEAAVDEWKHWVSGLIKCLQLARP